MTDPVPVQRSNQSLLDFIKNLLVQRAPSDATAVVPKDAALNLVTGIQGNNPLTDIETGHASAGPQSEKLLERKFRADPHSMPDEATLSRHIAEDDKYLSGLPFGTIDVGRWDQDEHRADSLEAVRRVKATPDTHALEMLAKILAKGNAP